MSELASKTCIPCQGGVPPLSASEVREFRSEINSSWIVVEGHHLEREFEFPNFREALSFANQVGEIAEAEGHHPDLYLTWGKLRVQIWTHKIDGLTESDFILAAKLDQL